MYNDNNNGYWSSLMGRNNPGYSPAPHYQIIRVNGEESVKNFRMAPNSEALLLDNTASIIWYAATDGVGFLTYKPFDVTAHQEMAPVDVNNLAARVDKLEEILANVAQPNKSNKSQSRNRNNESSGNSAD